MENKKLQNGQIKFLNTFGDITIEWDERDHLKMLTIIQEKLDAGFQFFIVKDRFCGIPGTGGTKKLKKISKLSGNKILVKDKDITKYFNDVTSAKIVNDKKDSHTMVENSRNAEKIARSTSVCSRPATRG